MPATVRVSGPLFNGTAAVAITRYCRLLETAVGDEGVTLIKHRLPSQYKYLGHSGGDAMLTPRPDNAGFYASQIQAHRELTEVVITDGDVIYGPWLEGVGGRNSPVMRFGGYRTFRVVSQELIVTANTIADRVMPILMEELNGV